MNNWTLDIWLRVAVPIIGLVAILPTLLSFFWTNVRLEAKRLAIIDLATKRTAFWKQYMETAQISTEEGSPERALEKARVYKAIQQIHSEALLQTQVLTITRKVQRATGWRSLRFQRNKLKSWAHIILWLVLIGSAILFALIGIFIFGFLEYRILKTGGSGSPISTTHLLIGSLASVFFFIGGRSMLYWAELLKHDDILTPIIDTI